MDGIRGITGPDNFEPIRPAGLQKPEATEPQQLTSGQDDRVEISDLGRLVGKVAELPEVRAEKIATVRASIAAGTYVTPAKVDAAIERLLQEL